MIFMVRVVAYCRVSTDKYDQINSFESQKSYFERYISQNPHWEMIEIYADEGLTGTSTKNRKSFIKMIEDAHLGKFDLILTKEVSRFARNTVDALQYTRELKNMNIGVRFLLDNIYTLNPDSELRLTIMASLAQEESRKTSERVKWGQRQQMEKGVVFGCDMLGYDVVRGVLHINEEGAKVVKQIFHKFVFEKKSCGTIARDLEEAGYKTVKGNKIWSDTVILKVLKNEKYCGDLIQKKTYTPDYLTHKKKYNHGEENFVIIKNHHKPIIEKYVWNMAQERLKTLPNRPNTRNSNRYPLSGKIFCGVCGRHFVSRTKILKSGRRYTAWRCLEAVRNGTEKIDDAGCKTGCRVSAQIRNEDFMLIIKKILDELRIYDKVAIGILNVLKEMFLRNNENEIKEANKRVESLNTKTARLLDLYLNGILTREEYSNKKLEYEKEAKIVKNFLVPESKDDLLIKSNDTEARIRQILEEGDETFFKNLVEKIVVHSREKIDIYLTGMPNRWSVHLSSM